VRWSLLGEIVSAERYLLGRSVFNMAVGVMQIAGFAVGGVLVAVLSARWTLLFAVTLYLLAAAVARFGLSERAPRSPGRPSVRRTWRVNGMLWSSPARRATYAAMWLPNGLIVGAEALFVPYSPDAAGALFMAAAFGMLAGDTLVGRILPVRHRYITPLRALLAAPFVLFALPLLHPAGMLTMQAVGATVAGALAQFLPVGTAMAVMAVGSLVVTALLAPALRRPVPASKENILAAAGQ
jgi:membrane protein implicated in regulation of membrane protease activity